ncbi:MAG TPA: hypothetical protein VLW85_09980, partial [Myxococcales bacterium]|nr:hypothetical protein [Myxococcales bacterium]
VHQQVDYAVVRAEMNGLDFDFRVLKPWARDPAFYMTVFADETDQPAREGPHAEGMIDLSKPLDDTVPGKLAAIPALLTQAQANLASSNARDLWTSSVLDVKGQIAALAQLKAQPKYAAAAQRAIDATTAYLKWIEEQAPSKTGPSGIGVENYDWYLANVQMVPYTWAQEVLLMERELARSRALLKLEEEHNRGLPELQPVASAGEHERVFAAAVSRYMQLLQNVLTVKPWMEPAMQSHVGQFSPTRDFFTEVDYRDPEVMRTHGYHWIDLARMVQEPNPDPIRRGPLLYNIFNTRTEGFATAMEELMMTQGLCDGRPRCRELIYILIAQRAARALGDLRMQSNQFSYEQAVKFACENTPRGWLRPSGQTVWFEQHLFLEQPAYGTSYLIGKMEFDQILARWPGTLKQFMDEKDAIGLIPASLVRWEMTGEH